MRAPSLVSSCPPHSALIPCASDPSGPMCRQGYLLTGLMCNQTGIHPDPACVSVLALVTCRPRCLFVFCPTRCTASKLTLASTLHLYACECVCVCVCVCVQAKVSVAEAHAELESLHHHTILFVDHPVMITHNATDATADAEWRLRHNRTQSRWRMQSLLNHQHLTDPTMTPERELSAIQSHIQNSLCKANWVRMRSRTHTAEADLHARVCSASWRNIDASLCLGRSPRAMPREMP